jgi:hypothetical protein
VTHDDGIGFSSTSGWSTSGTSECHGARRYSLEGRAVLAGTGPAGGEGMDNSKPKVAEHATRKAPVLEDFLYLFLSRNETSQAAGRAFWERRHTRVDQDVPSSMAAMGARATAIAGWGVVPQTDQYADYGKSNSPHPQRTPATLGPPEDPSGVIKPGERMWSLAAPFTGHGASRLTRRSLATDASSALRWPRVRPRPAFGCGHRLLGVR